MMRVALLTITLWLCGVAWSAAGVSEQSVVVKGLGARAEILVDQWGAPHIHADAPVRLA